MNRDTERSSERGAGYGLHHHHLHVTPGDRTASSRALWGALVILGVFLVVEVIGGFVTNSLALLSDAAHLLTDVAAVALALLAQWFARRPPSPRRSFGYRRLEIVAALLNGLTLWVVAALICIEAVERIVHPQQIEGPLLVAIAAAGCVAQIAAAMVLARASGESLNVRGAYLHALTDTVQSLGVVVGGIVIMLTGFTVVDPILSILISALIAWSGGRVVVEAIHVLLEGTPQEVDLERVAEEIARTNGVERITVLHAWSLTTGYNALAAHVIGEERLDPAQREELTGRLSARLREKFPIHLVTLRVEQSCLIEDNGGRPAWLSRYDDT